MPRVWGDANCGGRDHIGPIVERQVAGWAAEAFGFPWAFWCLFDGMGLMDDADRGLDPAMLAALGLKAR